MSDHLISRPVFELRCDGDDCRAKFRPTMPFDCWDERGARRSAREAGWSTRPAAGKGSRSMPDLCPDCAAEGEAS